MFQLTSDEKAWVVVNCDHFENLKYSPHLPYVFTEHGAIMAASVLNSAKAVEMSVFVVRAFVRMREILGSSGLCVLSRKEKEISLTRSGAALEPQIKSGGRNLIFIFTEPVEMNNMLPAWG